MRVHVCFAAVLLMRFQQVYDDEKGALQHVTFNREDSRGWPSEYWSTDTAMRTIKPDQVAAVAGVRLRVFARVWVRARESVPVIERKSERARGFSEGARVVRGARGIHVQRATT